MYLEKRKTLAKKSWSVVGFELTSVQQALSDNPNFDYLFSIHAGLHFRTFLPLASINNEVTNKITCQKWDSNPRLHK